jgi:hypothetical protein
MCAFADNKIPNRSLLTLHPIVAQFEKVQCCCLLQFKDESLRVHSNDWMRDPQRISRQHFPNKPIAIAWQRFLQKSHQRAKAMLPSAGDNNNVDLVVEPLLISRTRKKALLLRMPLFRGCWPVARRKIGELSTGVNAGRGNVGPSQCGFDCYQTGDGDVI